MKIDCECQTYKLKSIYKGDFQKYRQEILGELMKIRDNCEALREVLLANSNWKEYSYKVLGIFGKKEGYHESVLLKALRENILNLVTSPIHKYLLNKKASDAYKNNINDSWILKESFEKRQEVFSENYGKFFELLFAEWLENNGWEIINLEAWDENSSDVEAKSQDKEHSAFEIKTYFPNIMALEKSVKGEVYFGCGENPEEIEDKIYFMIIRAEEQLRLKDITDKRKIIVIIDVENKLGSYESLFPTETKNMLKARMRNCDELWVLKLDLFNFSSTVKLGFEKFWIIKTTT